MHGSSIDETALDTAVSHFLASSPYHACLFLIHPEILRLKTAVSHLNRVYNWPTFSVGLELSQALLPIAPKQRSRQANRILPKLVKDYAPGPLLCADIDLLFEPSLSLDPLMLLRQISRQVTLVVGWPGTYQNGILAYAVPEHAHYRTWDSPDLCDHCLFPL
ncbi:MAG: BREX-3 system P-loop-containing protein BrxF [Anaerolineales bacterium]|nr:BREX-3 system P-loop-containing protein BrxF [Anaerolineales bacterium]